MIEAIKVALRYNPTPNPRVGAVLVDKNNKLKKLRHIKIRDTIMQNTVYLRIQKYHLMIRYT